jgi:hypothetical protein
MPQVPVALAEWRPDIALLDNQFAADVDNVFADANSYKPIPSLSPLSQQALTPPVVGLTSARASDGTWLVYAGTRTKLYKWTLSGWTDVSGGLTFNVPAIGELWSFAQFGTKLYACNINDAMVVADVDSGGTNFATAPGGPPLAHKVTQLGDFLFLSGLGANRRTIRWSGINRPDLWTPSTATLCDEQEFPDGGPVQGVAGSEIGFVVQDRAVRTAQFLPGDTTFIWNFTRILVDKGSVGEFAFSSVGNVLYLLCEDGFYQIANGNQVNPIGQDAVNEWFLKNSDETRRGLVQCITSNRPYVIWAYHSSSAAPTYDKIIIYNWANQRWTKGSISAWVWAQLASSNLDLDTTGPETGDQYLDSPPAPLPPGEPRSLDSLAYVGGRPKLCAVDPNGRVATLEGPLLPATLETGEAHLVPGSRAFVPHAYPLIDAPTCMVTTGIRERLQDPVVWQQPQPLEITGSAAVMSSARLQRFRLQTSMGDTWTHAQAVIADAQQDGTVA